MILFHSFHAPKMVSCSYILKRAWDFLPILLDLRATVAANAKVPDWLFKMHSKDGLC